MSAYVLDPMPSWTEFLDRVRSPATVDGGGGRDRNDEWAGATWEEALRLAVDGWTVPLTEVEVTVGALRERAGLGSSVTSLEPVWDVTGAEVDVGAYLSGVPECMVDAVPRRVSRRGRVVSFLITGSYEHTTPHEQVRNRGLALAALCAAIIAAGHGVEIWSGYATMVGPARDIRASAVARVISAGERLDVGRLIFAVAHPAMLRRLWFSVWDGQDPVVARTVRDAHYGRPLSSLPGDLPGETADPYVFPHLAPDDPQWISLPAALSWCREMFTDLGLLRPA
ncbi:DUF7192 family protein [Phytomonospora endophytica]|uniref:DUF7192 domain-containing protein n=1 Tax=Phytomonospora endophytica TaxID=714109 RepID=A0A841FHN2_9ACTN|nr:hypothetical protein [Phytomonospora endophytica]MBB6036851.1 hypothetical protein [Phytomonospora endophytica]GIG68115.1 hypothetical protein Pen01_44100 [Phytomonospora endophytica]